MCEKEAEEIEKEAIKWVKDVFPNDEFKQSGISRALVEFAELGYNKANERLIKANEIIKGLMRFCRCFAQHHTEDIRYKEAEQFLRELE